MKKPLKKRSRKKEKKKPLPTPGGPWCLICNGPCKDKCEV